MKTFLTNIKIPFLVMLLFSGGISPMTAAPTLHAFIVTQEGATISAPTDKSTMIAFLSEVAAVLPITINKKFYSSTVMTKSKLDMELERLNTGADDIIWFFYSGHGSNNGDGWPKTSGGELPESYVFNKLKTKTARLRITTYECCNYGATVNAFQTPTTAAKISTFQKLFLQSKGNVLMAGCKAENYSYGNISQGGIFTCALMKSIKTKNSWQDVLTATISETKVSARGIGETQEPIGNAADVTLNSTPTQTQPNEQGQIINSPDHKDFQKTFPTGMTLEQFAQIVDKECTKQHKITQKITIATLKQWNQEQEIPQNGNGQLYWIRIESFSTKAKTATSTTTTSKGVKASSVVKKVMSNQK